MTFHELYGVSSSGARLGITAVGDRVMIVEMVGTVFGITTDIVTRLSAGARLVSHHCLDIKVLDYFYWRGDGELRFCFIPQEGCMEPVPAELVETMDDIDARYPPLVDPHRGSMFFLAEHLTGIKPTPQLLEEATYLCGVVPEPEWDIIGW